ncbi:septum site-determining protein MinC [Metabacillus sp. SLBN-84]
MKAQKQHYVTIKGTKDGLTLHLDDSCSFEELLNDLEQMLSLKQYIHEDGPTITVNVKAGNRLLHRSHQEQIEAVIQKKRNLVVETFESNVVTKEHAARMKKEAEIVSVAKVIRSGQVLKVDGDLLLIGDVNPGGTVIAGGNIFIMGTLRGIAHAGYNGKSSAVIAASVMMPSQIRIGSTVGRAPDYVREETHEMECAYIDESESIVIDRLQQLTHLRPELTRFEGGI